MRPIERFAVVLVLALATAGVPALAGAATVASSAGASAGRATAGPAATDRRVAAFPPQQVGTNRLVTVRSSGQPAPTGGAGSVLSEDGSVALIGSADPGFLPGQPTSGFQLYLRDLTTGATQLISHAADGAPGNGDSTAGDISADGTHVTYVSEATNLAAADSDAGSDVYLYDSATDTSRLVSHAPAGQRGNAESVSPHLSADGTRIAYTSEASNLDPGGHIWPNVDNIYLYDQAVGRSKLVTRSYSGTAADTDSGAPDISGDGSRVVFWSLATNLVRGSGAGYGDVYLYDQNTGAIELASRTVDGRFFYGHKYYPPSISADGTKIAYASTASSLPTDPVLPGEVENVYLYDPASHVTRLVTRGYDGGPANGVVGSYNPVLSADGRRVTFTSDAKNLVRGDANSRLDVFAFDTAAGVMRLVSKTATGGSANGDSYAPSISPDGRFVIYNSTAKNLVARDTNAATDGFVFRLS